MSDLESALTRRQVIKMAAVTTATLSVLGRSPAFAASPLRKNIDALTAEELDNYKHAISILIQKGMANPAAKEGYVWQAALHNDFERVRPDGCMGACEHHSELFLPWHRAHLAGFQALLRAADPPRTTNVTIPYWDWTKPASGVRFPIAFEDTSSPLFHDGRNKTITPFTPRIQWDAEDIKVKMIQEKDWLLFSGNPLTSDGTGGACPNFSGGSYGWVEAGPHNTIHGSIGPTMGNPERAARDPIYWSFHAYIDLIWARWQRVHTSATKPQPFTTPNTKVWVEPFVPVIADMAQTDGLPANFAYGYDYDFSIDGATIEVSSAGSPTLRQLDVLNDKTRAQTTAPLTASGPKRRILRVKDITVLADLSYAVRAYVHPPTVDIAKLADAERTRYLADTATIWMSGGHAHHGAPLTNVNLDVTRAIESYGNGAFAITVLTDAKPIAQDAAQLESLRMSHNERFTTSAPLWRSLQLEER